MPLRLVTFGAARALMHPAAVTDLTGLALGGWLSLWQYLRSRKTPA